MDAQHNDTRGPNADADSPVEAQPAYARRLNRALRVYALLAFVAFILAQGLAPALPGSGAGLGTIIQLAEMLGALLTQLTVWFGVLLCSGFVFATLVEERLRGAFRFLTVMTAAAILALVMTAARSELQAPWALTLAVLVAVLAVQSCAPALASERTRALALVLLGITVLSSILVVARLMALEASEAADAGGFARARAVATLAFMLDVGCLTLVAVWWVKPAVRWRSVVAVTITVCAAALAWRASGPTVESPGLFSVLVERGLSEITHHPDPYVPAFLRYFVELVAVCFTPLCVLFRGGTANIGPALGLALIARGGTDAPAGALLLAISSLVAAYGGIQQLVLSGSEPPAASEQMRRRAGGL